MNLIEKAEELINDCISIWGAPPTRCRANSTTLLALKDLLEKYKIEKRIDDALNFGEFRFDSEEGRR